MPLTPRQALLRRRNEYLSRISILDRHEPPGPVDPSRDRRPADIRRFRAGGDEVDPGTPTADARRTYTRATLDEGRGGEAWRRHNAGETDPSDWEDFARGAGGPYFGIPHTAASMDLYRITGILVRATERWRRERSPAANDLFDLLVSELPRLEDSGHALGKAFALLQVCGVDMRPIEDAVISIVLATDWTEDVALRNDVAHACRHAMNRYFLERPAHGKPQTFARGSDAAAVTAAAEGSAGALLAAFGDASADGIVTDLVSLGLDDAVIARLVRWLGAKWTTAQNTGSLGQWETAPRIFYMLQFLGRMSAGTVREACLLLAVLGHNQVFQGWTVSSRFGSSHVWAAIDRLVEYGREWTREAESTDDLPFRLAAMLYRSDDGKVQGLEAYNLALRPNLSTAARTRLVDRLTSPGPNATPLDAFYWRTIIIGKTLAHILALQETADFHVCEHIRFLGHFRRGGRMRPIEGQPRVSDERERWLSSIIPDWFLDLATAAVLRFKFWIEDNWTFREDGVEMTFWSENHIVLFASSEYIAGQWWPDETFSHQNVTGAWHRDRGRRRVLRWLEQHLRFGFAEVNSAVYYNFHIAPILNLVDFVDDRQVRTLAVMVMDLLAFDVARHVCQGAFVAASTRGYPSAKTSGWGVSIRDFIQLTTGTLGDFSGSTEGAAISLATSTYLHPDVTRRMNFGSVEGIDTTMAFPECLALIAVNTVPSVERSRTSISFDDAGRYGIGTESADDIVFWWSHGGYFTPRTYRVSQSWARRWNLEKTGPFKLFGKFDEIVIRLASAALEGAVSVALLRQFTGIVPGAFGLALASPLVLRSLVDIVTTALDLAVAVLNEVGQALGLLDEDNDRLRVAKPIVEQEIERLAIEFNKGSVIEREHLYVWRSADAMLSSLVDEKKGETSAQKEVCIASLGPDVCVFANKPPVDATTEWTEDVARGILAVPESAAVWETIPGLAEGLVSSTDDRALPVVAEVAASIGASEATSDGPAFWQGQSSNPLVWQHENVAIQIYNPTSLQQNLSHGTHVFWPWERFDEVQFDTVNGGWWMFGRRDRRDPPTTPRRPVPGEVRFPQDGTWPAGVRREESGAGSGYVAVFSCWRYNTATGNFMAPPAPGWAHREIAFDGDVNVMITIVGDRQVYGSFVNFRRDVLATGLTVSMWDGDPRCALRLPRPGIGLDSPASAPLLEVSWKKGATVNGTQRSTDDWPRFELMPSTLTSATPLPLNVGTLGQREGPQVPWDSTNWCIRARTTIPDGPNKGTSITLALEHDFKDLSKPYRHADVMPVTTSDAAVTDVDDALAVPNLLPRTSGVRRFARPHRADPRTHLNRGHDG